MLYTIEPPDPRRKKKRVCWKYQQRILAVIDPRQEDPPEDVDLPRSWRVVRRHPGVTRKILAGAVGRACLYPVQMMRGPAEPVTAMLEMRRAWGGKRRGFRMASCYGLLRHERGG